MPLQRTISLAGVLKAIKRMIMRIHQIKGIGHAWNAPGDISPRDGTLTLNEVFRYVQKYNTYQISSEGEYYSQYVQCYPEGSDYRLVRHY